VSPSLPAPRGPLSQQLVDVLSANGDAARLSRAPIADPLDQDVQLALYTCYELHYRGFQDVSGEWEWDGELLNWRRHLERAFLDVLRDETSGGSDATGVIEELTVEPLTGEGMSHYMLQNGTWPQMLDLFKARSMYHLKEADPHAFVIPRLDGRAKAALVAVEFDEYGGGVAERVHARLFADLLAAAGLDPAYLAYIDEVPGEALCNVNFMSMCGLHRNLRGSLVGLFAAGEIVNPPSAGRMVKALNRLEAPRECVHFYAEHVEADAVHEQVMRRDVLGDLLTREPELSGDVVFGVEAAGFLESRLASHLIHGWQRDLVGSR
jgi:hypothetical protein